MTSWVHLLLHQPRLFVHCVYAPLAGAPPWDAIAGAGQIDPRVAFLEKAKSFAAFLSFSGSACLDQAVRTQAAQKKRRRSPSPVLDSCTVQLQSIEAVFSASSAPSLAGGGPAKAIERLKAQQTMWVSAYKYARNVVTGSAKQ